jgi:hypothetical protein
MSVLFVEELYACLFARVNNCLPLRRFWGVDTLCHVVKFCLYTPFHVGFSVCQHR